MRATPVERAPKWVGEDAVATSGAVAGVDPTRDGPGDSLLAIRNTVKLGGSLLFTWSIALAMRFLVPRQLGPTRFGTLSFADAFATTFFVALSLGAESYARKEVAQRPAHASDFFGGTFMLRIAISTAIFAIMAVVMQATGRPPEVKNLVYLFGLTQFFIHVNATLSALLHAKGSVGGMSVLSVATKVIWAVGVVAAIATGAGLWAFGAAYLASESVETVVLFCLANRYLGLVFRVDVAATKTMIVCSLPYYLNTFATTAYSKLDLTVLALLGNSREVGWYAAASGVAGLTLLLMPLIGWVLTPAFARAATRSHDELYARVGRATEVILAVAIPASLFIGLGAPLWVRLLFGESFGPAALALRILAATFVLTYIAVAYAITLMMLERAWSLTFISIGGLVVNLVLNLVLVRHSMRWFGEGGGGAGCALAMLGTEVCVVSAMVSIVGKRSFDRRTLEIVGKSLAASALAIVVDRFAAPLGTARLAVDAFVYAVFVVATGALRTREVLKIVKTALRRDGRSPGNGSESP